MDTSIGNRVHKNKISTLRFSYKYIVCIQTIFTIYSDSTLIYTLTVIFPNTYCINSDFFSTPRFCRIRKVYDIFRCIRTYTTSATTRPSSSIHTHPFPMPILLFSRIPRGLFFLKSIRFVIEDYFIRVRFAAAAVALSTLISISRLKFHDPGAAAGLHYWVF